MTRTQRAILVALAIGVAAYKASGECPPEDFESFATGTIATDIVPGGTYYLRIPAHNKCGLTNSDITMVKVAHETYCECLPDLDGDGAVGFNDLSLLLGNWGACAVP